MRVVKRNGEMEAVSFDKVTARIRGACDGLSVNPTMIAQKVLGSIIDGIEFKKIVMDAWNEAFGDLTEEEKDLFSNTNLTFSLDPLKQ